MPIFQKFAFTGNCLVRDLHFSTLNSTWFEGRMLNGKSIPLFHEWTPASILGKTDVWNQEIKRIILMNTVLPFSVGPIRWQLPTSSLVNLFYFVPATVETVQKSVYICSRQNMYTPFVTFSSTFYIYNLYIYIETYCFTSILLYTYWWSIAIIKFRSLGSWEHSNNATDLVLLTGSALYEFCSTNTAKVVVSLWDLINVTSNIHGMWS